MSNILLVVEYDGTVFRGWQRQKRATSAQGALESALHRVLQQPVEVIGASRTDAGCHAKAQVVNFHTTRAVECEKLKRSLNGLLGGAMVVLDASQVEETFHARFDALSRTYSYLTLDRRSALWAKRAWFVEGTLVKSRMNAAARMLVGEHDCGCFAKRRRELASTVCRIRRASWSSWEGGKKFWIEADRFLPGMIRKIVAVMVWVGLSRLDPHVIMDMMNGCSVRQPIPLAPAEGLYLEKIRYEGFCFEPG